MRPYAVFSDIVDDYLLILSLLTIIFVTYCQDICDILGSEGSDIRAQRGKCQNPKTRHGVSQIAPLIFQN